jgi:hypothetical protein
MTRPAARRLASALALLLVAALPALGRWSRSSGERCAWDGVRIDARHRARLVAAARTEEFCGVACLVRRLARAAPAAATAFVTDETRLQVIEAERAWFVRSAVVTVPANGSRLHAFATEEDARHHAAAFHGTVLPGPGLPSLLDLDEGPP